MRPAMGMPGKGEGPFQFPFGSAWRASRHDVGFVLERRRFNSDGWDWEGWFSSRREARRVLRDLARTQRFAEFRIRRGARPPAD